MKIAFCASPAPDAQEALTTLVARFGSVPETKADVIVALGGDGFMLQTLQRTQALNIPIYGMNRGTVGFLMNSYHLEDLPLRLENVEEAQINPLSMIALTDDGQTEKASAINEVSLLRMGPQAGKLRIYVDDKLRLDHLVADGALVATPAGSTAYNYSAHGPILPVGSDVLALTAMSAFRPRRWRGALLPRTAKVRFEIVEPDKRPMMVGTDNRSVERVLWVEVTSNCDVTHRLWFDPGHGLSERLIAEQFT